MSVCYNLFSVPTLLHFPATFRIRNRLRQFIMRASEVGSTDKSVQMLPTGDWRRDSPSPEGRKSARQASLELDSNFDAICKGRGSNEFCRSTEPGQILSVCIFRIQD